MGVRCLLALGGARKRLGWGVRIGSLCCGDRHGRAWVQGLYRVHGTPSGSRIWGASAKWTNRVERRPGRQQSLASMTEWLTQCCPWWLHAQLPRPGSRRCHRCVPQVPGGTWTSLVLCTLNSALRSVPSCSAEDRDRSFSDVRLYNSTYAQQVCRTAARHGEPEHLDTPPGTRLPTPCEGNSGESVVLSQGDLAPRAH